jgi:phosphonate transport system permease protein
VRRWATVGVIALYFVMALASVELDWARIGEGIGRGARLVEAFLHPDFSKRGSEILDGILESLAITAVATVAGVVLSVPVGFGAAANLSPKPLYLMCRGLVTVGRSFHEILVAIFFVVMVGFGPLAGVLTLAFASVGFLGKLLAEEIEAVDPCQIEAIRAAGASWPKVVVYAVVPQVFPRMIGLSVYRLDINFRESSVIGVVGAGGIGATLNTAFSRYEFDTAAAVLLLIIGIVMVGEIASGRLRRRFV